MEEAQLAESAKPADAPRSGTSSVDQSSSSTSTTAMEDDDERDGVDAATLASCAVAASAVEAHEASSSSMQPEDKKPRRGRISGSRAKRELLDSEGFALQWNASQQPLGSERLDQAQTRGGTRSTGPAAHPTDLALPGAEPDGEGASEELPAWARATRRCLRLHNGADGSYIDTSVSVGSQYQATMPPPCVRLPACPSPYPRPRPCSDSLHVARRAPVYVMVALACKLRFFLSPRQSLEPSHPNPIWVRSQVIVEPYGGVVPSERSAGELQSARQVDLQQAVVMAARLTAAAYGFDEERAGRCGARGEHPRNRCEPPCAPGSVAAMLPLTVACGPAQIPAGTGRSARQVRLERSECGRRAAVVGGCAAHLP